MEDKFKLPDGQEIVIGSNVYTEYLKTLPENREFNPEDIPGFKLFTEDEIIKSYQDDREVNIYLEKESNLWSITPFQKGVIPGGCDYIKIKNHRFGVELLQGLGVIE